MFNFTKLEIKLENYLVILELLVLKFFDNLDLTLGKIFQLLI